ATCDAAEPCLRLRRRDPHVGVHERDDVRAVLVAGAPGTPNRPALALDGTPFVDAPGGGGFAARAHAVVLP
ncbi:MAG: hypothetical protein RLW62_15775, partial [Gammaproteobacteria bacterium]